MPKFHGEKAGAKSTPSKVIKYVLNEDKTLCYDTIGLSDEEPYSRQFRQTAALQGSEYDFDERKYYHYKLTFAKEDWDKNGGKITPEYALKMAREFCNKHFPGHEAVLSVHGDTDNLHVHIVLNAYSYNPGQNKIHINDNDYRELKDDAFEIGKEYGLEEKHWRVETVEKRERERQERENQQSTEPINLSRGEKRIINKLDEKGRLKDFADHSWKEQYRIAIDEAKKETTNLDSFRDYLKENFHIDTQITKYGNIKYKSPERTTYSSGKSLGSDYELEAVESALEETKNKPSDLPKEPAPSEIKAYEWQEKFNEEYAKFQKWQEEEYQKQRGDWLKKEKDADASAEFYRNKTVLENTEAFYRLCQEAMNNEALAAMMTDKQRTEMVELERRRERLMWQEKEADRLEAITQNQKDFWDFRNEMKKKYREDLNDAYDNRRDTRGTYYDAMRVLRNTDNILVMAVAAGTALYSLRKEQKINEQIQELREQRNTFSQNTANYETFQKAYSAELQAGKLPGSDYMENVANAYRTFDREHKRQQYIDTLQTTGTSISDRIAAAQGIVKMNVEEGNKSREKELYRMYGRDTRTMRGYRDWDIQRRVDSVRIARELGANNQAEFELKVKEEGKKYGQIKREHTAAKKQYDEAVDAATAEIAKDSSLSVEERIKKLEEIKATEYEKIRPIEEKFQEAKEHYKECARALETVKANSDAQTLYTTPEQSQEEKKEEAPKEKKEEEPRRTKEEAVRFKNRQWSELRDWSDEAIKTVAEQPGKGKETDLKEWASEMEKHGCTVRITANTISVKHPNSNQPVRMNRLGGDYEKETIENVIKMVRSQARSRAEQPEAIRTGETKQPDRTSRAPEGNSRAPGADRGIVRQRSKER